jgi:hypothetical protein
MKTRFLFPNKFKIVGWILFMPSLICSVFFILFENFKIKFLKIKVFAFYFDDFMNDRFSGFFKIIDNNITDELLVFGLIIGGILTGFSKLKNEDEMISKIRYESLVWATYLNYGLIILFTIFFYGIGYYSILIYNTFTLLLFFIIRFHYMIYKLNKANQDDE